MGNCLKTQLKESVNNDSLVALGATQFRVALQSAQPTTPFTVRVNKAGVKIRVKGNGHFATSLAELQTNPLTEYTFADPTGVDLYLENGNYYVEISDKDAITYLDARDPQCIVNTKDISYMSSVSTIYNISEGEIALMNNVPNLENILFSSKVTGSTASITALTSIRYIALGGNIYGTLSELASMPNLSALNIVCTNISGSINDFSDAYSMVNIVTLAVPQITGEIRELAEAQKAHRANGDTLTIVTNGTITLDGTALPLDTTKTITFDGAGGYTIA